ncbi:N-acetylmuramoyl-L-alanine amidase family protein [Bartonella sp. F02]|uniref:N-acetylmuramoyl-L-alanine amidase family protein n=1 Tax=Bartonella sp. F02 TaxID=2967262 RepID=UPI0022A9DFAF|nr:N-acetylmuramoyl-L-alanine amidase [Bartonella sp. F02]MCZ2328238.1 N-acetylmuramoyl-L-alanine amidase [Bartonella sp. F02]
MIKQFVINKPKMIYRDFILYLACFLFLFILFPTYMQGENTLKLLNFRTIGDDTYTRVIAVFNREPNFRLQILNSPARLVINFPAISLSENNISSNTKNIISGMFSDMHYSSRDMQTSNITLTSKTAFSIEKSKVQKLDNGSWQLLVDIAQHTQKKINKQSQINKSDTAMQLSSTHRFRVVLDPGHGGIDSGAQGVTGILEKNVTLAFARALQNELKKYPNMDVILTRDSNVFLRLGERVKKAQKFGADLFISIHADSIDVHYLRGATVYTISDKASDAIAKYLAESENKVDLLDGLPADETPEVTDILIDLARRETNAFSVNFADRVILNLSKNNINLINNPHRYADFQVLKAPDIPSVLIEIGYLSNKEDEKLLNDPQWRQRMAASIAFSIRQFAEYRKEIIQSL